MIYCTSGHTTFMKVFLYICFATVYHYIGHGGDVLLQCTFIQVNVMEEMCCYSVPLYRSWGRCVATVYLYTGHGGDVLPQCTII